MQPLFVLVLCIATARAALADGNGRNRNPAPVEVTSASDPVAVVHSSVKVTLTRTAEPDPAKESTASYVALAPATAKPPPSGLFTWCDASIDEASLRALVQRESASIGVDAKLALTILSLESNDGAALNSNRSARGPMQLIPDTAALYGVKDICDPVQNVHGALLFLKDLTAQFQGNMMLIAAAYNAGPERVYDARGIPAIAETVRYVASAANKYYGLGALASPQKRGGAPKARLSESAAPELSREAAEPGSQSGWIGGMVLYVRGSESGETQ
jgi:soluble lytic murein transglycosylase-like protein